MFLLMLLVNNLCLLVFQIVCQWCFMFFFKIIWFFKSISRGCKSCFESLLGMFQSSVKGVSGCIMGITRVLEGISGLFQVDNKPDVKRDKRT